MGVSLMLFGNSDVGKEYDDDAISCSLILSTPYYAMVSSDSLFGEASFVRELERKLNFKLDILINHSTIYHLENSFDSKYWLTIDELRHLCDKVISTLNRDFPYEKMSFSCKENINQRSMFMSYLRNGFIDEINKIIGCTECYQSQGSTQMGFGIL